MGSHRVLIEPTALGDRDQRYRVTHDGRVLIESTQNPKFDTCCALLAQAVTGKLEIWRPVCWAPGVDITRA